jgi:hypothetical protein
MTGCDVPREPEPGSMLEYARRMEGFDTKGYLFAWLHDVSGGELPGPRAFTTRLLERFVRFAVLDREPRPPLEAIWRELPDAWAVAKSLAEGRRAERAVERAFRRVLGIG